jgi:hypothetical protein
MSGARARVACADLLGARIYAGVMCAALATALSRSVGTPVCISRHIVSALGGGYWPAIFLVNGEIKTALADSSNARFPLTIFNSIKNL